MRPTLAAGMLAFLVGCASRQGGQAPEAAVTLAAPETAPGAAHYIVPQGWIKLDHPGPLQLVAFRVPDVSGDANAFVMSLTNYTYGLLVNVNRCREQVGLPPIDANLLNTDARPVKTASGEWGSAFRIVGQEKSILFAAFARGETTWFFKLKAPNALAEREREAFDHFICSFRLDRD